MEVTAIKTLPLTLLGLFALAVETALCQEPTEPATAPAWVGGDPFEAPVEPPAVRLAQSTEAIGLPKSVEPPSVTAPKGPPERGLFQGADLVIDWMPRLESDSLGRSSMSASVSVGVPPLLFDMPLLITPRAGMHLLDGPDFIDVPADTFDLELGFGTFKKLAPRWSFRGSVNTGVYGDEDSLGEGDAFRVSGFGAAIFEQSPAWTWTFGVAYLNRDDIPIVPAVGVIHDRGDVRYELMFPRPRIVWRLPQDECGVERSVYLAGELGGGAWAVRRTDGTTDTLNLSRWGVVLGYETKGVGLASKRRYEFGYVFGRHLEYASDEVQLPLDDSLIARVGWSF